MFAKAVLLEIGPKTKQVHLVSFERSGIPSITYGAHVWFDSSSDFTTRTLKQLQRVCLLALTECFKTASATALDVILLSRFWRRLVQCPIFSFMALPVIALLRFIGV